MACMALCCFGVSLFAQQDTSRLTAPVTVVTASKMSGVALASKLVSNDSNIQKNFVQNTLADAIRQNNLIHLKSYGTGLQTVSFRGTGAEHTAVYWEGIPINSATNGTVDFAHLPAFFFNEVSINYGDGGAGLGSGAVGGSVSANSNLSFRKHKSLSLELNGGSFSNYAGGIGFQGSNGKWSNSTKVYYQKAKNDFFYNNPYKSGKPEERMRNNGLSRYGALQQIGYKIKHGNVKLSTMFLHSSSELGNIALPNANETQEDKSVRTNLQTNLYLNRKWKINASMGHSYEYLRYLNPGIEDSEYKVQGLIGRLAARKTTKKGEWNSLVFVQFQQAQAINFSENPKREELGLALSYQRHLGKRLFSKTTVKGSVFNGEPTPLNFGEFLSYQLNKFIEVKASVNSIYRLPTFNDLYWLGSGNPDLKPESGWKQDLGVVIEKSDWKLEATGFHLLVDNWLIWLPSSSRWEPQNIRKVRSTGVEIAIQKTLNLKKWQFIIKGAGSYTNAINLMVESGNQAAVNKQLIYVPREKSMGALTINKEQWYSTTTFSYTGQSYSSSDNSQIVESYGIWSSSLGRKFNVNEMELALSGSIENILDERYYVVAGRPVPGRTFWIKINYKLK